MTSANREASAESRSIEFLLPSRRRRMLYRTDGWRSSCGDDLPPAGECNRPMEPVLERRLARILDWRVRIPPVPPRLVLLLDDLDRLCFETTTASALSMNSSDYFMLNAAHKQETFNASIYLTFTYISGELQNSLLHICSNVWQQIAINTDIILLLNQIKVTSKTPCSHKMTFSQSLTVADKGLKFVPVW